MSQQYDTLTDTLNNYISTQISAESSWTSVAGGLTKASASAIGSVWGFQGSQLFICQLPCTGNWKPVPFTGGTIIDLTTDDLNVYVLTASEVYVKHANNTTDWVTIKVPSTMTSMFDTQSYIWIQDSSNKKWRLAKPGMTGNWIRVHDKLNIRITSTSASALYGVSALGVAMKSDETLQTNWSAVPEFAGKKMESVVGDIDSSALYGVDTANQMFRCAGGCSQVSTKGLGVSSLTIEPSSRNVWLTTNTAGTDGNVFMKADTPDLTSILKTAMPLDTQRDELVNSAKSNFVQATRETAVSKQLKEIKDFLSKHFSINQKSKKVSIDKQGNYADQIKNTSTTIDQLNTTMPVIQQIIYLLIVVAILYFVGSIFGWVIHLIATIVLGAGLIYILALQK